ncbi:hypothetical protein J3E68DRAFT_369541 [Trichoderma sp. SZMC 28012]
METDPAQDRTGQGCSSTSLNIPTTPSIGIGCYNTKRYEARSVGCHLRRAYRIRTSTADELRASRHVRRRQIHPWPLVRLPHGVVRRWVKISLLLGPRAPTGHCRQANHGSGAGTGADKREHGRGERKKRDEPLSPRNLGAPSPLSLCVPSEEPRHGLRDWPCWRPGFESFTLYPVAAQSQR